MGTAGRTANGILPRRVIMAPGMTRAPRQHMGGAVTAEMDKPAG